MLVQKESKDNLKHKVWNISKLTYAFSDADVAFCSNQWLFKCTQKESLQSVFKDINKSVILPGVGKKKG